MVPIFFQRDQLYLYNLKDVLNSLRFYIKLDSLLEIYKIIEKITLDYTDTMNIIIMGKTQVFKRGKL